MKCKFFAARDDPMDCSICLAPTTPDDQFRPHNDHEHVFHQDCIYDWMVSMTNPGLICPYCSQPMLNIEALIKKISGHGAVVDICWKSRKTYFMNIAMQSDYYDSSKKVLMLRELLLLGKHEEFDFLWNCLEYDEILPSNLNSLMIIAQNSGLQSLEFLYGRGYVRPLDVATILFFPAQEKDLELLSYHFKNGYLLSSKLCYNNQQQYRFWDLLYCTIYLICLK